MSEIKVLLVDDDLNVNRLLSYALTTHGFKVTTASDGMSAIAMAQREQPDIVLLDVAMPVMDGCEVCRRLRASPNLTHLPVIMFTAREDTEDKVIAFEAGADDYVVKPVAIEELIARIKALMQRAGRRVPAPTPAPPPRRGRLLTFFSLKGGVGTSTMAVNLGVAIQQLGAQAAIADLCLRFGTVAALLDLPTRSSVASLAQVQEVDQEVMEKLLIAHESGVRALLSPSSPVEAERIQPDRIEEALRLLKGRFDYVVVDTDSTFEEVNLRAFDLSDLIVVVVSPDINAWRAAREALEVLDSLGIPKNRRMLLYNHTVEFSSLSHRDVTTFCQAALLAAIPFCGREFVRAANTGQPLVVSKPNHPSAVAIRKLAAKFARSVTRTEERRKREEPPTRPRRVTDWLGLQAPRSVRA